MKVNLNKNRILREKGRMTQNFSTFAAEKDKLCPS